MFDWMPIRIFWTNDDGANTGGGDPGTTASRAQARSIERMVEYNEAAQRKIELNKQLAQQAGMELEAQKQQLLLTEKQLELEEEYLGLATGPDSERQLQLLEDQIAALNQVTEKSADQVAQLQTLQSVLDGVNAIQEKGVDIARQEIQQRKQQISLEKEHIEVMEEAQGAMQGQIDGLFDFRKATILAQHPTAMFQKLLASIVGVTIQATMAYDGARSELMKLTGGSTQLNAALADTIQLGAQSGLTFKEAAEGMIILAGSMANFSELSRETQRELGDTAGIFNRFGINVGESMNIATKGMGFTAKEANNLQLELFAAGTALGPFMKDRVMKDFGPAMASLAAFTKERAIKIFKELAAQAKATGMEITELTNLAEKFDTYDSAAESVGRLNSILGGDYLNSIQMLNATESERISMLQNSLRLSGRQFTDLSRFEKKALAATVGIKDMTKAMQLFGTSSENIEAMRQKAEAAGMTLEEFRERSKATNDISKQFQLILQNLAVVAKPVVTILSGIASFLAMIASNPIVKWTLATVAALSALAAIIGTVTAAIAPMLLATGAAPAALVTFGKSVAVSGAMVGAGAKGFGILGVALLGVGAGVLMAGGGILLLAMAFERLVATGPKLFEFAKGIGVLALSMALLGGFGLLGGIFGAIGGGVMAAFILGIGTAMSFVTTDSVTKMTALAGAVKTLSAAMKEIEGVKADVVVNTVRVFESIGNIKASSGIAAQQAIESFRQAVVDVRAQNQIQLDLKIEHNNVKATEDSFREFTKNLNKALNKGII